MVRLSLYCELLVVDCASLLCGFYLSGQVRPLHWANADGMSVAFIILPIFVALSFSRGAFSAETLRRPTLGIERALKALLLAAVSILCAGYFLEGIHPLSKLSFAMSIMAGALLISAARIAFGHYAIIRAGGRFKSELVILDRVLLATPPGTEVIYASEFGIRPDLEDPTMLHRFGTCVHNYDRVIVSCLEQYRPAWALLLKGVNVEGEILVPQFNDLGAIGLRRFAGEDTLLVSRGPLDLPSRARKRVLDLCITIPILFFLLPLLLIVALAIRLESDGPVLFTQDRIGRGNRLFRMYKFRSMQSVMCDESGAVSTRRNDNRITRVGRFIRKTSIDELPQLFNVLKGDMSLVGPRPHALGSLAGDKLFWEIDEQYWLRHALKPGITGLAQIRGYRGATEVADDLVNRLRADLEYLQGWDIWRDIAILFRTFRVLIHQNAY